MEILLRAGGSVDITSDDGWTPLHSAAHFGEAECVDTLARAGASLEKRNREGDTPLIMAVSAGRVQAAQCLISAGARFDEEEETGQTLLSHAGTGPFELLIAAGCPLPRERRVQVGSFHVVPRITSYLRHGLPLYTPGYRGALLRKLMGEKDRRMIPTVLLQCRAGLALVVEGTDPLDRDNPEGDTMLHDLARLNLSEQMQWVLDSGGSGVSPNLRNDLGETPLMLAVSVGAIAAVKVLLSAPGIDIEATDIYGGTALSRARAGQTFTGPKPENRGSGRFAVSSMSDDLQCIVDLLTSHL